VSSWERAGGRKKKNNNPPPSQQRHIPLGGRGRRRGRDSQDQPRSHREKKGKTHRHQEEEEEVVRKRLSRGLRRVDWPHREEIHLIVSLVVGWIVWFGLVG
jgi:hypothetical protein